MQEIGGSYNFIFSILQNMSNLFNLLCKNIEQRE